MIDVVKVFGRAVFGEHRWKEWFGGECYCASCRSRRRLSREMRQIRQDLPKLSDNTDKVQSVLRSSLPSAKEFGEAMVKLSDAMGHRAEEIGQSNDDTDEGDDDEGRPTPIRAQAFPP